METLKINIPEGYEIDTDNTDLTTGEISLRPKKKQLPKTWDEFCENVGIKSGESCINDVSEISAYESCCTKRATNDDKNLLPDKETAEAMLALCQLIQLRNCYNDGWKPDWSDGSVKYTISYEFVCIKQSTNVNAQRVLAFKTEELRDEFLKNFRDLIEIAKPLI